MTKTDNHPNGSPSKDVSLKEFQRLIRDMYYEKDVARGVSGTFMWLMEEVGELSSALRQTDCQTDCETDCEGNEAANKISSQELEKRRLNLQEEFADVLAWLATIANVVEIDLDRAIREKYGSGCPGCQKFICVCPDDEKP